MNKNKKNCKLIRRIKIFQTSFIKAITKHWYLAVATNICFPVDLFKSIHISTWTAVKGF